MVPFARMEKNEKRMTFWKRRKNYQGDNQRLEETIGMGDYFEIAKTRKSTAGAAVLDVVLKKYLIQMMRSWQYY